VAWLALLVALAALWLSWQAFQRTGGDLPWLDRKVEVGEPAAGAPWKEELARARERLLGHRDEVRSERNLSEVQRDVEELRHNLEKKLDRTGSSSHEDWRQVDGDMQRLEAELREKSAKAMETLDRTLDEMKRAEKKSEPPL
jgi:hypothetical protein